MQLDQHFADQMGQLIGPDFPADIAIAVSGGGDSMVMMHLAAGWARRFGIRLWPVTVDHGLRPESAAEAGLVADEAAGLGLSHSTLTWDGWDGTGNLQDNARRARLDLIYRWRGPCQHVLMAHTLDDQAETLLMRLTRGSGVDGLAGMAARRAVPAPAQHRTITVVGGPPAPTGVRDGRFWVLRPLLDVPREDLRHHAQVLKIPFIDDPSNDDTRFERVRTRKLIADAGLDIGTLGQTARSMRRAQAALDARAMDVSHKIASSEAPMLGYASFDRDGLAGTEAETRLRLVADAMMDIASQPYRPRLGALEAAVETAVSGGTATLHGCLIFAADERIQICRELNVVKDLSVDIDQFWDHRWQLMGPKDTAYSVRVLGAGGLSQISDWRETGLRREVLLVSPAIWQNDTLIAAPLAGYNNVWSAKIVPQADRNAVPH